MPKSLNARSRRPVSGSRRRKHRSKLTFAQVGVIMVIIGIIFAWWLITITNASKTYDVRGKPSLSAEFINSVLDHYHSPAAGKGQVLYNDGVKYGIDPAYALAFFMHESSFGTTGVAKVTHSLGNIRASNGYQQFEGYRMYKTWEEGFEDWYKLIKVQYIGQWKLTTVDAIVPVYAPGSDNNDVMAYIQAVKNAVDTWRGGSVEV